MKSPSSRTKRACQRSYWRFDTSVQSAWLRSSVDTSYRGPGSSRASPLAAPTANPPAMTTMHNAATAARPTRASSGNGTGHRRGDRERSRRLRATPNTMMKDTSSHGQPGPSTMPATRASCLSSTSTRFDGHETMLSSAASARRLVPAAATTRSATAQARDRSRHCVSRVPATTGPCTAASPPQPSPSPDDVSGFGDRAVPGRNRNSHGPGRASSPGQVKSGYLHVLRGGGHERLAAP